MYKTLAQTNFKRIFNNNAIRAGLLSIGEVNKSYEDTQLKQAFIINAQSIGYSFGDDDRPDRVIKAFFSAVSAYLSRRKVSKADEAVALILTDTAGVFKFAAIVEYHENTENPEEPGNWSYTMTFNEEDISDLEKRKKVNKLLFGDDAFRSIMHKAAYDTAGIVFKHDTYIFDSCLLVIDTILQVLDNEAKEGEVVDIEMPGYFLASVAVENGEKIFSITPDGHLKHVIKSDVMIDD